VKETKKPAAYSSMKKIVRMIVIVIIIGLLVNVLLTFISDFRASAPPCKR
jgi:hypothetical protein